MAGDALEKFSAIPMSQKAAILVVLMAAIGAAWYFLLLSGMHDRITTARSNTTTLTKRLNDANAKAANLTRLQEEIEQLKRQRDEMRERLPPDEEIASLLQKIHGQGKIVGLEIARFERTTAEPRDLFVRIPVRMVLTGTFQQITTFFYQVGKLTRIVNVENIEMTAKERDREGAVLEAVCQATTFMYRPTPEGGGAAPGAPQ